MVLTLTPMVSISCVEEVRWTCVKAGDRGQLDDAEDLLLDHDGQHHQGAGHGLPEARGDGHVARRQLVHGDGAAVARRLPDQRASDGDAARAGRRRAG